MKKGLLLTAMMAAAMTASAQTNVKVTLLDSLPVSAITNYAKATNRTAYGYGDKLYLNDRGAQQLRVFNLATNEEIGQVEIGANQPTGYDEAGNAIIANWGWASSNAAGKKTTFTLISADLKQKVTTNEVQCVQGRADFLGRAKAMCLAQTVPCCWPMEPPRTWRTQVSSPILSRAVKVLPWNTATYGTPITK